jgi:hypothetical protein
MGTQFNFPQDDNTGGIGRPVDEVRLIIMEIRRQVPPLRYGRRASCMWCNGAGRIASVVTHSRQGDNAKGGLVYIMAFLETPVS